MQAAMSLPARLPALISAGRIGGYIQAVYHLPMLSAEDERALALRLREHNDLEAAGQLVLSHLRLVVAVARGYLGYGLPHADLIQEGKVAPTKAQRKLFSNLPSMKAGLAPLTAEEVGRVAAALHVKPEEVTEMET